MARKRGDILIQDKNYIGLLPPKELSDAIAKLKSYYSEYCVPSEINGFMIHGGDGLCDDGTQIFNKFKQWAKEQGKFAIYNTKEDLLRVRRSGSVSLDRFS